MNQHTKISAHQSDIQIWKQDGRPVPGWLHAWMIGRVEANGTFLIQTPLGQQRVHSGYVVVEQAGDVYAWPAEAVDERVTEVRERVAVASRPLNMVGPGKSLKSAIPSRRVVTRSFQDGGVTLPTARKRCSFPPGDQGGEDDSAGE